jgi:hypothetical protein
MQGTFCSDAVQCGSFQNMLSASANAYAKSANAATSGCYRDYLQRQASELTTFSSVAEQSYVYYGGGIGQHIAAAFADAGLDSVAMSLLGFGVGCVTSGPFCEAGGAVVALPAGIAGAVGGGLYGLVTGNEVQISDVWGIVNDVIGQAGG